MIRTEHAHMYVAALSHPGMTGKNNEDSYGVSSFITSLDDTTPSVLAIVADGIGGHRAGEVAAEITVNTIGQIVSESNGRKPLAVLKNSIQRASEIISKQAEKNKDQQGMGATCAVAWVMEDRLYTATVGDSRIYLIRNEHIQQLSIDHSWVQEAVDKGLITSEEARVHPNVHVIRRYLGSRKLPDVDFRMRLKTDEKDRRMRANQGMKLNPSDVILLCSDGLTDLVTDDEIYSIVCASTDLDTASRVLITQANARGGRDNITVALLGFPEKWVPLKKQPSCLLRMIRGLLVLLLVGALALAAVWYFLQPNWLSWLPIPPSRETPVLVTETQIPTVQGTLSPSELQATPTVTPLVLPANRTPTP